MDRARGMEQGKSEKDEQGVFGNRAVLRASVWLKEKEFQKAYEFRSF